MAITREWCTGFVAARCPPSAPRNVRRKSHVARRSRASANASAERRHRRAAALGTRSIPPREPFGGPKGAAAAICADSARCARTALPQRGGTAIFSSLPSLPRDSAARAPPHSAAAPLDGRSRRAAVRRSRTVRARRRAVAEGRTRSATPDSLEVVRELARLRGRVDDVRDVQLRRARWRDTAPRQRRRQAREMARHQAVPSQARAGRRVERGRERGEGRTKDKTESRQVPQTPAGGDAARWCGGSVRWRVPRLGSHVLTPFSRALFHTHTRARQFRTSFSIERSSQMSSPPKYLGGKRESEGEEEEWAV